MARSRFTPRPDTYRLLTSNHRKHQIQDVDFGSLFPSAPPAPRSAQKQASLAAISPAPNTKTKTPASRRRTRTPKVPPSRDAVKEAATVERPSSGSDKRRKLDSSQSLSSRSTRSSLRTPRPDIYSLEEEAEGAAIQREEIQVQASEDQDELSPMIPTLSGQSQKIIEATTDEVAESPRDAPGSGTRRRTGGLGNLPQSKAINSVTRYSTAEPHPSQTPISSPTVARRPGRPRKQPSPELMGQRPTPRRESQRTVNDDLDELSPEQPLRRGRKSLAASRKDQFSDEEVEEADELEEAEEIDDVQVAARLGRQRRRVNPDQDPDDQVEEAEELAAPLRRGRPKQLRVSNVASQELPTQVTSPAIQRQPKLPKKQKRRSGQATGSRRDAIPITVNRLTKPLIPNEDNDETDILNSDIPFAKRGGVNAVDVLAQFCEEIVSAGLATLEENGAAAKEPAVRREFRTKLRAVEAFQEELRTRLLELVSYLACDQRHRVDMCRRLALITSTLWHAVCETLKRRRLSSAKNY